jgi:hypothetical protein
MGQKEHGDESIMSADLSRKISIKNNSRSISIYAGFEEGIWSV